MFKKSKILSILIAFALLFSFTLTAYASDITYYNVDATTKWTMYASTSHMGSKSTTYKYDSTTIQTTYETAVKNGIGMWGSNISCTNSSSTTVGAIKASALSSTATAETGRSYNSSTMHTTTWSITIYSTNFDKNNPATQQRTIAHEIGHVYGLMHVPSSSQIMYDTASSTKSVTSDDKAGMDVMTHAHTHTTTHSGTVETHSTSQHKVRCSTCKAYRLVSCTYSMYHSGTKHYLDYNCACGNKSSSSWNCSGNPCILPFSIGYETE